MRTLNVKRLVVVLVVVIVVAGSAHLLHSYQVRRNSRTFKNQAEDAWNDSPKRVQDALRLMNAYLGLAPHDYEAREELGGWLFDVGQFTATSTTLEELLRSLEKQNPPDLPTIQRVRRKVVESAMKQGRCEDAAFHLKILSEELPDDVDVWKMLGMCQITLGQEEKAIECFSAAIKLKPEWVELYIRKAHALRAPPMQKLPEAEQCMAEMIAYWEKPGRDQDKAAYAHHAYALWFKDLGKYDEALKQAEKALTLKKDHPGALFVAAEMNMAMRHFPKAQIYAQSAISAAPKDPEMYALMADICQFRNDQPDKTIYDQQNEALEVLEQGLKTCESKPAKAELLWRCANLDLERAGSAESKGVADAEECMRKLRDYGYPPARLAFLDARVAYAKEDWKSAREGFEKVRPQLGDTPLLLRNLDYWIGFCYLQQGNDDQAMAAFRSSLAFDKFYFNAHDRIAQVFLAHGQFKEAALEYQQALAGNPANAEACLAVARTLLRWNLNLLRRGEEQNWDEVDRALRRAEELAPRDGQVKLLIVESLAARRQADQAANLLKSLRESSPQGIDFWIAQANLAAQRGAADQARTILDEAKAKLGDRAPIRLAQARMLLRQQGLQAGAAIEKLAAGVDAFSPTEKARLWEGLMDNLQEIKEYDRAKQLCRQIALLKPNDAMVRYRLFELAFWSRDAGDMAASLAELDRVLDEIDKIAGQGPLWLFCKAVRLNLEASRDKPELWDKAMDYATQAEKMRQSWSWPYVLEGEICRAKGQDEEALQHYKQAASAGDRDPQLIRLLLQMLSQRQRDQEAELVIQQLDSSQTPLTTEIGKEETEILVRSGDFQRALESAKRFYDPASDDYLDHLWHGRMLKILARRAKLEGHPDKLAEIKEQAEQSFRRACQLAPNTPECRVELVQLLIATDQKDKALVAAKDAEEMIPTSASPLAMGYIYEALDETGKAGQCYEKAFQRSPDLPLVIRLLAEFYVRGKDPQRAAPLIERLLSSELQAGESDLVAARRLKAVILLKDGYPKLKEAIELINRNLASPLASRPDKRLKVRILLADPRRARGPEVLALATSLVATNGSEPDPEDRFQLARLYLARGEWEHCREQMGKLVNGNRGDPRYLAAYVRMLLDHDETIDAQRWLDRLDPDSISNTAESVALRADLMFRLKHWSEVPRFLADYVSREKGEPKEPLDRMLIVARLLEDFGSRLTAPRQKEQAQDYFEKARTWYESYAQKRPGGEMLLAGFHARYGKVDEAIRRIESHGDKSAPQEVFEVVGAVVGRPETTPSQLKKLESVVVALLGKMQRPAPLLAALAEIQAALDRLEDAEKTYREILGKDPHDDLASNNLGMLLALQKTKLDEALALIDKAIERVGPLGPFLDTRAVVFIARHEPRRALEDLEAALAEKSTPVRLFHQAWAFQEDGNLEKAKEVLQSAKHAGFQDSMLARPEREIRREIDKEEN